MRRTLRSGAAARRSQGTTAMRARWRRSVRGPVVEAREPVVGGARAVRARLPRADLQLRTTPRHGLADRGARSPAPDPA